MLSARTSLTIGLMLAALAFGGWKTLVPTGKESQDEVVQGVSALLSTTTRAAFTGAEATLDVQRSTTGSYAGAQLAPGVTLVRADAASYCVQTQAGPAVQHVAGPGGTPAAGPC